MLNIIEEMHKPEEQKAPIAEVEVAPMIDSVFESPKSSSVLVPANKQIESRRPDGKRRITPMFLKAVPSSSSPVKYVNFTTIN